MIQILKKIIKKNKAIYSLANLSKKSYDIIAWRLNRPKAPINDGIYLHLGCGDINHPKMINVDLRPGDHIHYLSNVEKLPMFPANYADLIYVSHCLEHISYQTLDNVLKEWHRVLKPKGILRVSVPNFDTMIAMYNNNDQDITQILPPLLGGQDYKYNFHYAAFNEKYLKDLFAKNGFNDVKLWDYNEDEFSKFDDWANRTIFLHNVDYKISLNIQGNKI